MEAAWAALGGLPDLLTTFKTDLTNWFTFDAAEFNEAMAKLSEAMKPAEMPEPPTKFEG
ncbi:unnamed protein product [marine sediment metagenome]|uniref:Uncharacterized protein n=1 Tax=marine sediment metagenome TaxID=412755 RepID=X1TU78_9ZZZZ